MSPQVADHLKEARFFQEDSVRLIKDAVIASGVVVAVSGMIDIAVNKLFSDEKAYAITEKTSVGSAGMIAVVGGIGLLGALSSQARAGIEKHRAHKVEKTETRLAHLRRYTPPLEEAHKPHYYPERYELS